MTTVSGVIARLQFNLAQMMSVMLRWNLGVEQGNITLFPSGLLGCILFHCNWILNGNNASSVLTSFQHLRVRLAGTHHDVDVLERRYPLHEAARPV